MNRRMRRQQRPTKGRLLVGGDVLVDDPEALLVRVDAESPTDASREVVVVVGRDVPTADVARALQRLALELDALTLAQLP